MRSIERLSERVLASILSGLRFCALPLLAIPAALAVGSALFAATPAASQLRFDSQGNIIVTPPKVARPAPRAPQPPVIASPPAASLPAAQGKPAAEAAVPVIAFPKLPAPKGDALERTHTQWSYADLLNAQASCLAVARRHGVTFTPLEPIKRGHCGDPQPVSLAAIRGRHGLELDPPATVNCGMVAALAVWVREDLQRLAQTHMGQRITKIRVMSDYSCRNIYGRRDAVLSQHAKANALDIRGFVFADGSETILLADWGPTRRELRTYARNLASKKEAQKQTAATETAARTPALVSPRRDAAPSPPAPEGDRTTDQQTTTASAADGAARTRGSVADDENRSRLPRFSFTFGGSALGMIDQSAAFKLGGPKEKKDNNKTAALTPDAQFSSVNTRKRRFLRAVFNSACRRFGTVLGPEYDATHRNHFHVDLSPRRNRNFCR